MDVIEDTEQCPLPRRRLTLYEYVVVFVAPKEEANKRCTINKQVIDHCMREHTRVGRSVFY